MVSVSGMTDLVYNDFMWQTADVDIVAGCGIQCNSGWRISRHDGIHTFHWVKMPMYIMRKNTGEEWNRLKQSAEFGNQY